MVEVSGRAVGRRSGSGPGAWGIEAEGLGLTASLGWGLGPGGLGLRATEERFLTRQRCRAYPPDGMIRAAFA